MSSRTVRSLVLTAVALVGAFGVSVGRDQRPAEALAAYYDPGTSQGSIYRLYRAYFLREPDLGGFTYWRTKHTGGTPGLRAGTAAQSMLAALPVAAEPTRTGYDRDLFKHWDENGNGCDTRCEILNAEKRSNGQWYSLWDGTTATSASALEIDHVVALAEAWDSGASTWTSVQRDRFADWQVNLTAVSSSVNQSKGDKDAGEWTPPRAASRCAFAEITVTTKFHWALAVDQAEKDALSSMLQGCKPITSNPPPVATTTTTQPPTTTTTKPPSGCKTAGIYLAKNGVCVANDEEGTGDVDCGQLPAATKPVRVINPKVDPYRMDGDHDGWGCDAG